MALRAKWTVRIERLETRLAVGVLAGERKPQPVLVSLVINGLARVAPAGVGECIDYRPVCDWITREWPRSAHTPLLETRINQLLEFVFGLDKRVQDVCAGVYRRAPDGAATLVGVERQVSRAQFDAQLRIGRPVSKRGRTATSD